MSNIRRITNKFAASVYRLLQHVVSRFVRIAAVISIAGAKSAIDFLLHRDRPQMSFEDLNERRYNVYLLFALANVSTIGCTPRNARLAYEWMPVRDFIRSIRINWRAPTNGVLLSESAQGPNILHVNRQYYSSAPSEHRFFASYFAHPEFYKAGLHNTVLGMRERKRTVRIFFAGTHSDSSYSENFRFPILSRDKILSHFMEQFEEIIKIAADDNGTKSILIILTNDTRDIVEKHKLSMRDYMDWMSRSEFFICPPGWLMPHSHNLIEAMSVGTIPITNYHSYMRPPLTPDADCLAFSTLPEFEDTVKRALLMDVEGLKRLREGVLAYYDQHLKPESFGKKLMERPPTIQELVVNDESGT